MGRYTEIRSFLLVTESGSFAAAAIAEGVTPVVMGRRLDALERRLGVRLMHRSTRGLTLTALGEQFIEPCRQLLRDFDLAENSISAGSATVRGHLVVSAPAAFGRSHVAPHAPAFRSQHPELKMSFNLTDSVVDLVREGYDMSIRIGEVTDPNYVAVPLFPNRRVVCGTPGYFERHGTPARLMTCRTTTAWHSTCRADSSAAGSSRASASHLPCVWTAICRATMANYCSTG